MHFARQNRGKALLVVLLASVLIAVVCSCDSQGRKSTTRVVPFGKISRSEVNALDKWLASGTNDITAFVSAFPECEVLVMRDYRGAKSYRVLAQQFLHDRYVFNAWVFVDMSPGLKIASVSPGEFHFWGFRGGSASSTEQMEVDKQNQLSFSRREFDEFVKSGRNFQQWGLQLVTNQPLKDYKFHLK